MRKCLYTLLIGLLSVLCLAPEKGINKKKTIIFPVTIVIDSGIDIIYGFEDSLHSNTKLKI